MTSPAERTQVIARARLHFNRKWPEQLTSGVMFFEGERITLADFDGTAAPSPGGRAPAQVGALRELLRGVRHAHIHDAAAAELDALAHRVEQLEAALKRLDRHYVRLLECARDRIIDLGGTCDPVDVMERADPALREARAALSGVSP